MYNDVPYKFEAGTPNIAGVARTGRGDRLPDGHRARSDRGARAGAARATPPRRSRSMPGLRLIGTAPEKAGVLSFVLDDVHPHDIGTILDREGVAIRAGHHCCQPLMARLGVPATARASLALYNTREEIDALVRAARGPGGVRVSADVRFTTRATIRAARPLSGGHPRPQQAAAEFPRDRGRAQGRGVQPALRRPPHGVRARRR